MAQRRQVPRYLSGLNANVLQPANNFPLNVTVVTLSIRGARVEGAATLNPPQKCQLSIDWQGKQVRIDAEVIWKNKEGRAGLRFLTMDKESELHLRDICTTLQLQPLAKLPEEPDSTR
jgi:hypothetical protein